MCRASIRGAAAPRGHRWAGRGATSSLGRSALRAARESPSVTPAAAPRTHRGCLHRALDPVDRPAMGGAAAGYANGRSSPRLDAGREPHAIEPGDSLGRPPCHRRRHRCPRAPARPCVCASAHHARALAGAQRGLRRVLAPRVDPGSLRRSRSSTTARAPSPRALHPEPYTPALIPALTPALTPGGKSSAMELLDCADGDGDGEVTSQEASSMLSMCLTYTRAVQPRARPRSQSR